jgi:hypothetical protein
VSGAIGSSDPISILAHPRSGASLLRYILDAHPAIGGRGRLQVASRGCDRSALDRDRIEVLQRATPDTRFVCLHRQCLDVVSSCREAYGDGQPDRLRLYIERNAGHVTTGLIESWCDCTDWLIALEKATARAFRLKYEDLIADHDDARLHELLAFLGVEWISGLTERLIAQMKTRFIFRWKLARIARREWRKVAERLRAHRPRATYSIAVMTDRVGRGRCLDMRGVPDALIDRMNRLLGAVGYGRDTGAYVT